MAIKDDGNLDLSDGVEIRQSVRNQNSQLIQLVGPKKIHF